MLLPYKVIQRARKIELRKKTDAVSICCQKTTVCLFSKQLKLSKYCFSKLLFSNLNGFCRNNYCRINFRCLSQMRPNSHFLKNQSSSLLSWMNLIPISWAYSLCSVWSRGLVYCRKSLLPFNSDFFVATRLKIFSKNGFCRLRVVPIFPFEFVDPRKRHRKRRRSLDFSRLGFHALAFVMSFLRIDELKRKNRDCSLFTGFSLKIVLF